MRALPDFWYWTLTSTRAQEEKVSALPVLRASLIAEVISYSDEINIKPDLEKCAFDAAQLANASGEVAKSHTDIFSYQDFFSLKDAFLVDEGKAAATAFAANSALVAEPMMVSFSADSDLVYNGFWNLIRADVSDFHVGGVSIRKGLWQRELNPFSERWTKIKRLCDDGSADWSFWIKWYDAALNGEPLSYEMLERIALIPRKDWEKGPAHLNELIAKIEREFETTQTPRIYIKSIQQAVVQNREGIASQLDALTEILAVEIERLRGKNPVDEIEQEECDRLKSVFEKLHSSLVRLGEVFPSSGEATKDEAEEIEGLLKLYVGEFANWPRENAKDMVDSTVRVALVGLTAGVVTLFGASALVGVAIGGVAFGGKKLVGAAKAIKESASDGN